MERPSPEVTHICITQIIDLLGDLNMTGVYSLLHVYSVAHRESRMSYLERKLSLQESGRMSMNVRTLQVCRSFLVGLQSRQAHPALAPIVKSLILLTTSHHTPPLIRPTCLLPNLIRY